MGSSKGILGKPRGLDSLSMGKSGMEETEHLLCARPCVRCLQALFRTITNHYRTPWVLCILFFTFWFAFCRIYFWRAGCTALSILINAWSHINTKTLRIPKSPNSKSIPPLPPGSQIRPPPTPNLKGLLLTSFSEKLIETWRGEMICNKNIHTL